MSNEYGHGAEINPRRYLTDEEIKSMTKSDRWDLMATCNFEPTDPDICDGCAAYVLEEE